jgi:hypothetical protein
MLLYKGRARADAGEGGDIFVLDVESADGDVLADGKYSGDIVFASAPRMMRFGD